MNVLTNEKITINNNNNNNKNKMKTIINVRKILAKIVLTIKKIENNNNLLISI